jgi:ketosteroid isomerase-like protein
MAAAGDTARAMSQENVEIVVRAIGLLNARDADATKALCDEEIEWRPAVTAGGAIEGAVYRGLDGMVRYFEEVDSGFAEMRFETERLDEIEGGRVLFRGRVIARGARSGVPIDVPVWGLWTVRRGKLTKGVAFLTEQEALEAVGLAE